MYVVVFYLQENGEPATPLNADIDRIGRIVGPFDSDFEASDWANNNAAGQLCDVGVAEKP